METRVARTVNENTGEILEAGRALAVTPQGVADTRRSIALLQQLTRDMLVKGRDYGSAPGIPRDFLWDSGASLIISSFQCHAGERRLIHFVDDGERVAVVVEVPLVSFGTGKVVATGIGAASTAETKYKYRWEQNPREWGYSDDAIKTLRTKVRDGRTEYRIPNPEHGELVNTIVKMGSKRAEVDAAESLPGVSSTLRELFDPRTARAERQKPDWAAFWGKMSQMGLEESEVHDRLGVTSLKQWLAQGKTLDDAVAALEKDLKATGGPTPPVAPKQEGEHDAVMEKDLPDLNSLEKKAFALWKKQPAEVYSLLGYGSKTDCTLTPWQCFVNLREIMRGPK